jgi:SAM-dependent methyltransferase
VKSNPYESTQYLGEYLLFHYGRPNELCPYGFIPKEALRFHEQIRKECMLPLQRNWNARKQRAVTRGLDLGCGLGRFTFELGLVLDEVVGVDNSKAFIAAARRLARGNAVTIRRHESGAQFIRIPLSLPKPLRRAKALFEVGDAMNLGRFRDSAFDVVAAINLICRLPSPKGFLKQLHRLVQPGGQLLIGSPFSWLGAFTPPREWLAPEKVINVLAPHFRLARRRELPFVIREHRRKYQLVISEVMTFLRRGS